MNLKVKLPNPSEMSIEDWFSQMELALYHAKKSYEKYIKDMDEKQIEDVSIYLRFPELEPYMEDLDEKEPQKFKELSWEDWYNNSQEIEIIISH